MIKKIEIQLFNVAPTYLHDHGFELESTLSYSIEITNYCVFLQDE